MCRISIRQGVWIEGEDVGRGWQQQKRCTHREKAGDCIYWICNKTWGEKLTRLLVWFQIHTQHFNSVVFFCLLFEKNLWLYLTNKEMREPVRHKAVAICLVWLSRFVLVRPLLPFSLSCLLLQLANQPNHCPPLLLPPPSLLALIRSSSLTVSSKSVSLWKVKKKKHLQGVCAFLAGAYVTAGVQTQSVLTLGIFNGISKNAPIKCALKDNTACFILASCCIIITF